VCPTRRPGVASRSACGRRRTSHRDAARPSPAPGGWSTPAGGEPRHALDRPRRLRERLGFLRGDVRRARAQRGVLRAGCADDPPVRLVTEGRRAGRRGHLRTLRIAGDARRYDVTSIPRPSDLAHECRVDDEVAEGLDECQVDLAKLAARLDVDAHLRTVTTIALLDPCKVQNTVHGGVRDLGSPFVVGTIQGGEAAGGSLRPGAHHRTIRAPSKLIWEASAQRSFSAPGDWTFFGRIVPTEPGPQAKPQREECATGCTLCIGGIKGGQ